jgi:hypothetical protein
MTLSKRNGHFFLSLFLPATSTNALEKPRTRFPGIRLNNALKPHITTNAHNLSQSSSQPRAEAELLNHDISCGAEALSMRLNHYDHFTPSGKKATNPP